MSDAKGPYEGIDEELLKTPPSIGLRQQGHMETVARMLLDGKTWEEIGAEIHWHPETAKHWWSVEAAAALTEAYVDMAACCLCRTESGNHCPESHPFSFYRKAHRCGLTAHHSFQQHRGRRRS